MSPNFNLKKNRCPIVLSLFVSLTAAHATYAFPALLSDDQSLSLPATGDIHFERVRTLGLHDRAEADLLSIPIKFPKLNQIGLNCEKNNSKYIEDLVSNYPNTGSLFLAQKTPISDYSMKRLASLSDLKKLSLSCPIESPILLNDISVRVDELSVYNNNNILDAIVPVTLKFPKLKKLDIRGQAINETFFSNLYAPKLRHIFLGNVTLSAKCLNGLSNFAELRSIEMYRTPLDRSQVTFLRGRHIHLQILRER